MPLLGHALVVDVDGRGRLGVAPAKAGDGLASLGGFPFVSSSRLVLSFRFVSFPSVLCLFFLFHLNPTSLSRMVLFFLLGANSYT